MISLPIGLVLTANDNFIKENGTPATATYLEQKKAFENISDINSIIYTFIDNNGDTVKVESRTYYSDSEAEELAKMGSFPIMYKGKKSVIMLDKNKK